jgi:penicillin-binding protein 1A
MAAATAPKLLEIKPGPPPVLTRRGADVLVQVEKMLDDAAKTTERTTATEPPRPARPASSSALAFPDSFAAATPSDAAVPRKN